MSPSRGQGQLGKQRLAPFPGLWASHLRVWRQEKYSGIQVSLGSSQAGAEKARRWAQRVLAGLGVRLGVGILTSAVPGARYFYSQSLEPEIRIEERSH